MGLDGVELASISYCVTVIDFNCNILPNPIIRQLAEIADHLRVGAVRRGDSGDVPRLLPGGLRHAPLGLGQGPRQAVAAAMLVLVGRAGRLAHPCRVG